MLNDEEEDKQFLEDYGEELERLANTVELIIASHDVDAYH